jgi:Ser/Thr protein kinase RdoA (MazF antagonist)
MEDLGRNARDFVLDGDWMPDYLADKYADVTDELLDEVEAHGGRMGRGAARAHLGDCHRGNILWTDAGAALRRSRRLPDGARDSGHVDAAGGRPAGNAHRMTDILLKGYEQFLPFDRSRDALIEPLRALRMIHYSAWLARRWHDPRFPAPFRGSPSRAIGKSIIEPSWISWPPCKVRPEL